MTTQQLGEAVLKLTTDTKDLDAGVDRAKEKTSGLTDAVGKLITAYLSLAGLKKVFEFLKSSLDEFIASEKAATLLTSALRATGQEYLHSGEELIRFSEHLQSTTIFSHEATETAAALLIQLSNLTENGVKRAMPAVMDLATALGMDLQSAAMLVSKALDGNVGALKRYGIEIGTAKDPAQQFKNVIDGIEKGLNGTADALARTTGGQLTIFKNQLSELKEGVGGWLAQTFLPAVINLNKAFDRMAQDKAYAEAIKAFHAGTADAAQKILYYTGALTDMKAKATQLLDLIKNAAADPWADAAKAQKELDALNKEIGKYSRALMDAIIAQEKIVAATNTSPSVLVNPSDDNLERQKTAVALLAETGRTNATWADVALSRLRLIHDATLGVDEVSNKTWADVRRDAESVTRAWEDMRPPLAAVAKAIETDWKAAFTEILTFVNSVFSSLNAITNQYYTNQNIALDNWYKAQIAALGDMTNATQAQIDAKKKIDDEYAARQKEIQKKQWETMHEISLGQAIQQTAVAVVNALGAWPPGPWNIIEAGILGALGAVQVALIAGQTMPAFAGGGDFVVPPGYPDDSFPMRVQSGEHVSVTPAGGEQPIHVVVNLDSQPILDAVTRGARNGRVLIRSRSVVP